jgi:tetratricopeptide (TPR) repeat protein
MPPSIEHNLVEREADTLSEMGRTHHAQEDYDQAVAYLAQSREMYLGLERFVDVAFLWCDTGNSELRRGSLEQARHCFQQALEIALKHEYVRAETFACVGLGTCCEQAGEMEHATTQFEHALRLLQSFDHPREQAKARLGLGRVLWRAGRHDEAQHTIETAFAELETRQRLRDCAELLKEMGIFFREVGAGEQAITYLQAAHDLFTRLDKTYEVQHVAELSAACA